MQELISKAKDVAAFSRVILANASPHLMLSNPGDIDYLGISKMHSIHTSPEI